MLGRPAGRAVGPRGDVVGVLVEQLVAMKCRGRAVWRTVDVGFGKEVSRGAEVVRACAHSWRPER